jgi:hypothetical protein
MSKVFRPSNRESSILSKIESSKEFARRRSIIGARDQVDPLSNSIAMKLIDHDLIETTSKNSIEDQIKHCIEKLSHSDDFEIDYQIAPYRFLVAQPNIVSLYTTAFVLESLLNHKDVVDIYGSDEEIYACINTQVEKILH